MSYTHLTLSRNSIAREKEKHQETIRGALLHLKELRIFDFVCAYLPNGFD